MTESEDRKISIQTEKRENRGKNDSKIFNLNNINYKPQKNLINTHGLFSSGMNLTKLKKPAKLVYPKNYDSVIINQLKDKDYSAASFKYNVFEENTDSLNDTANKNELNVLYNQSKQNLNRTSNQEKKIVIPKLMVTPNTTLKVMYFNSLKNNVINNLKLISPIVTKSKYNSFFKKQSLEQVRKFNEENILKHMKIRRNKSEVFLKKILDISLKNTNENDLETNGNNPYINYDKENKESISTVLMKDGSQLMIKERLTQRHRDNNIFKRDNSYENLFYAKQSQMKNFNFNQIATPDQKNKKFIKDIQNINAFRNLIHFKNKSAQNLSDSRINKKNNFFNDMKSYINNCSLPQIKEMNNKAVLFIKDEKLKKLYKKIENKDKELKQIRDRLTIQFDIAGKSFAKDIAKEFHNLKDKNIY